MHFNTILLKATKFSLITSCRRGRIH